MLAAERASPAAPGVLGIAVATQLSENSQPLAAGWLCTNSSCLQLPPAWKKEELMWPLDVITPRGGRYEV